MTILLGCGAKFESSSNLPQPATDLESRPPVPRLDLDICGPLDFSRGEFPSQFSITQARALALGLSITGSFEGHESWNTIANNFDDQGMSLGLLQQNFGQGSLQPLLITMNKKDPIAFASFFSPDNLVSLTQMLAQYQTNALSILDSSSIPLFPLQKALSPLDNDFVDANMSALAVQNSSSLKSVTWALNNIYSDRGVTFKIDWKNSFQNLADSTPYRSLQLEAAAHIFERAQNYAKVFSFHELRLVLLMFDFVVQNGGFNTSHLAAYKRYQQSNPQATATDRAFKLLEIRLASVRSEYQEDVRRRKTTIIMSTGTVHQASRHLPSEYCYDPLEPVL